MTAARLLLDRACPPLKAVDMPVRVEGGADDLAQMARRVLGAALAGEITPDAASALLAGVAGTVRAVELVEIENRLRALEGSSNGYAT